MAHAFMRAASTVMSTPWYDKLDGAQRTGQFRSVWGLLSTNRATPRALRNYFS